MTYKLFLDDLRGPPDDTWIVVRSSTEALDYIIDHGVPFKISYDHDLGEDDTTMIFLKRWESEVWDWNNKEQKFPEYVVHSANPVGKLNIISFMESWKKVFEER